MRPRHCRRLAAPAALVDYSLGAGYAAGRFNLALKWIDGSDLKEAERAPDDVFSSEARIVFSIAATFPWERLR
jgi:hypothetical protein